MAGRVVVFGATGYTGRLTAEAMVERGMKPVLAARGREQLERMAAELGGLEIALADVAEPASVAALVERGDVLVSTVGPFMKLGAPAAAAASTSGAHYIDSTGEPPFIREVFERYNPAARESGSGMLTAFGYDFVPGNLAGALALERAGERALRVDVGYFFTGKGGMGDLSGGTRATMLQGITEASYAFRDGRVRTERAAARWRSFDDVAGKRRDAIAIGASEHFTLPRLAPQLQQVNAYLGWMGSASRVIPTMSRVSSLALKLPGAERAWGLARSRLDPGSTGGPGPEQRAKLGSHAVGIAYDASDEVLAEVHVTGVDPYTFTGRVMAWGAERAAKGGLSGAGALGPVDAFGLRELEAGCAEAGLKADSDASASNGSGHPAGEHARAG
jgi:short subunit dehydrogenase-like uncharacterized protein